MSYNRITVPLSEHEEQILRIAASKSCRRPQDHARYIILKSLGLVTDDGPSLENSKCASVEVGRTQTSAFAGNHL